jgi:chemotaxis protein CheD
MGETKIELPSVYLHPGEVHLARTPTILKTLLGSCVGATFWDPRAGLGALCHGVLPRSPRQVSPAEGYRYVDFSIRDLLRRFESLGARRSEMQVKLFGGADVLPVSKANTKATVGRQNLEIALEVLREENLKAIASDLGGNLGRAIQFHTGTGEVSLRRLQKAEFEPDDLM